MKICLFSPYIPDHVGGGEKYLFDVADVLSQNHQVYMAINRPLSPEEISKIKEKYQIFLNRSLEKIHFISAPLGTAASFWSKLWWTRQFDRLYYLTDGSLFFSLAAKNILHVQVPLKLNKSGFIEQRKLRNWQVKNTNSAFTKSIIEPIWPVSIDVVHHPLVELSSNPIEIKFNKKEKIILSVGRFFRQLHSKRQDKMVEMFKDLLTTHSQEMKGWKLILVGAVEDESFAKEVSAAAKGYPIEIFHQVDRLTLIDWYTKASIYWHAAGFGVDQVQHPERVEHFGISTAEAMLAGCAPVVIGKGGQPEVLGEKLKSWLWLTASECKEKTLTLIQNPDELSAAQQLAQQRAQVFGRKTFSETLLKMVE